MLYVIMVPSKREYTTVGFSVIKKRVLEIFYSFMNLFNRNTWIWFLSDSLLFHKHMLINEHSDFPPVEYFSSYLCLYRMAITFSYFLFNTFWKFLLYHRVSGLGCILRKNNIWQICWWCQQWSQPWWTAPNLEVA